MPWKETCVMDERLRFVGRLLSGEKMAPLCREFGISRVTGHKIWNRYKKDGARGIYNRSRAPHKHPNQIPFEVEQLCNRKRKIHITRALANQPVGLREVDDGIWQVDFMSHTLGYFDVDSNKFAPIEDPFGFRIDS